MDKKWIGLLFLGLSIVLLKLFIIDFDPPHWDIANLQPLDELYYVFNAYNYYETGTIFNGDKVSVFGTPWVSNFFTYLSLEVFGDNYLGLRFSSILFSLISVFFFWKLLKKLISNTTIALFAILFLVLNYAFTLANIIVEPTIARLAGSLFSLYLIQNYWDKEENSIFEIIRIAFIIGTFWLFIYPTNAFLVLAFGITVAIKIILPSKKTFLSNVPELIKNFSFIAFGLIMAVLLWGVFSNFLGENPLNFFDRGEHYSNRVGLSLKNIALNIVRVFKANIFVFNPIVIFMFLISLGSVTLNNLRNRQLHKSYPLIILLYSFLLQSIFINDFPQRKLIMLLPFITLLVAYYFDGLKDTFRKIDKSHFRIAIVSLLCFLFSFFVNVVVFKLKLNYFSIIATIIMSAFLAYIYYSKKQTKLKIWLPIVLCMLFVEIGITFNYTLVNNSRNYDKMFSQLSEYDGKNFIGGFSMGFRTCNDIKPVLNAYLYYDNFDKFWLKTDSIAKSNNEIDYSIGYSEDSLSYSKIGFSPIKVLLEAKETIYTKDIILYKEK